MMVLSDGERISMIRSVVLTQYTRVTDRQTDRQTERQTDRQTDGIGVAYTRYSIYAVAHKNEENGKERRKEGRKKENKIKQSEANTAKQSKACALLCF